MRAVGLTGRTDLNGQRGTVISFNDQRKRFAVEFDSGESVLLRPENLVMAVDDDATSASGFHAVEGLTMTCRRLTGRSKRPWDWGPVLAVASLVELELARK